MRSLVPPFDFPLHTRTYTILTHTHTHTLSLSLSLSLSTVIVSDPHTHTHIHTRTHTPPPRTLQAIDKGSLASVVTLLDHGAMMEKWTGWTPLGLAIQRRATDIVALLLSRGADVKESFSEGIEVCCGWACCCIHGLH
jgi:hypothetical protein